MKPLICVVGPTASGKSAAALSIAEIFGGEILSCDSMQIYKGLNVGTAKPTPEEMNGVPHHLISILEPSEVFSVSDYVNAADTVCSKLEKEDKYPVLCGGTGLYYSSFIKGISFSDEKSDPELRAELLRKAENGGLEELIQELADADPDNAYKLERDNVKRIVRSVELLRTTGLTVAQQTERSVLLQKPKDNISFCLCFSDRQLLYDRINLRCDKMMEQGILDEAEYVFENREFFKTAAAAIGYKEFFPFFRGEASLTECLDKLKQASRNYAKRQITWFKRENTINIICDNRDNSSIAGEMVKIIEERTENG